MAILVPSDMPTRYDVLVIGGGLAGIAATQRLTEAGLRVALVEARGRFGGRVWTRYDPSVGRPLELGPEWFDSYGTIHRLLAGQHSPMPESDGSHWRRVGSELRNVNDFADGGRKVHKQLTALEGPDRTVAAALREAGVETDQREAVAMLRHYIEGFHAADVNGLSLAWFKQVEENQPAEAAEMRASEGLDKAVHAFLKEIGASCTAYMDTIVQRVRWSRHGVAADCTSRGVSGTIHAKRAIVTLPLAVLASGNVKFDPPLLAKKEAMDLLATGPVLKLNLVFDEPFWWDLPDLADALFLQDFSQPIPTWWTTLPEKDPVLVGWAAGPQVARVETLDSVTLRHTAIQSLAHALRVPQVKVVEHLRGIHWHDWQRDPFALGAYSWIRAGGVDAHKTLGEPIDRTLFFAGEATCGNGMNATMDGAAQSGWRAASELLQSS